MPGSEVAGVTTWAFVSFVENVSLPCVPGCKITLIGNATVKDVWEEYMFCMLPFTSVTTVTNRIIAKTVAKQ